MRIETRDIPKKSTLSEMQPGCVFLYPSNNPNIPDYVMLRVLGHPIKENKMHIMAVCLSDGRMLGVGDATLKEDTEYTIIPDAKVVY